MEKWGQIPFEIAFQFLFPYDAWHQHDLTFCAESCTAHQMEIFAQEFEPASYFCDCVYLGMRRQKQGPILENKLLQKMKLSKIGIS